MRRWASREWLRERFAEVSEHLLAHAPPFSTVDYREGSESFAWRGPLFPLAGAAVVVVATLIGWWTWTTSPAGTSKPSFAEKPAVRESAERATEDGAAASKNSDPIAAQKPIEPAPEFSRLADSSSPPKPEEHTLSQRSAQPRPPQSSREVAEAASSPPAYPPLDTGVSEIATDRVRAERQWLMRPRSIRTTLPIKHPALVALSVNGLPTESDLDTSHPRRERKLCLAGFRENRSQRFRRGGGHALRPPNNKQRSFDHSVCRFRNPQ